MDSKVKSGAKWKFKAKDSVKKASGCTIRSILTTINANIKADESRGIIRLGHGDPSAFPSFRTTSVAEDAVVDAVRSAKFNSYNPGTGILQARRSIAEYLSHDVQLEISPDDVYVTAGAKQAIDVIITVLSRPGANILFPRPGYPMYAARATFSELDFRYFNLLPEQAWEVDLDNLEAVADDNTVAMVLINPGNPCGNVYRYDHLKLIAETARKLGILVIADEAYGHLAFGKNPFVPMRVFGEIAPIVTLGSLSKRWMVPGWALGWMSISDPNGILLEHGIIDCIKNYLNIVSDPSSLIQAATSQILKQTPDEFYSRALNLFREAADICYDKLSEIPCITCPYKPEGSMFLMVELDLSLLEDIKDDMEFCIKLAREEATILLPGSCLGLKNWLRVTFAAEFSSLVDGLERIKDFCLRHSKRQ
ncbi:transaminase [Lithospermum erythrorhizon]|uniref:Transaminase n=1 Tax=Lithospermum erythrorhizon TaxID=34254 RepID=A0AAV3Q4N0_LITER